MSYTEPSYIFIHNEIILLKSLRIDNTYIDSVGNCYYETPTHVLKLARAYQITQIPNISLMSKRKSFKVSSKRTTY